MSTATVSEAIYTEVLSESPDSQKALRRRFPAERLKLDRPPDKQTDRILVRAKTGDIVGYLEKDVSARIAPHMDKLSDIETMVLSVRGGGLFSKRPRHCYIKISI